MRRFAIALSRAMPMLFAIGPAERSRTGELSPHRRKTAPSVPPGIAGPAESTAEGGIR